MIHTHRYKTHSFTISYVNISNEHSFFWTDSTNIYAQLHLITKKKSNFVNEISFSSLTTRHEPKQAVACSMLSHPKARSLLTKTDGPPSSYDSKRAATNKNAMINPTTLYELSHCHRRKFSLEC